MSLYYKLYFTLCLVLAVTRHDVERTVYFVESLAV